MQEEISNPIDVIRSSMRSDLKYSRSKLKDNSLFYRRLGLQEVSENVHNVTLSEFKGLLLKLKQKNVSLEVLQKIKSSCTSDEYFETFFRCDGAFNSLIRILIGSDAQKQLEATACLTNLACGSHKCSCKVAKTAGAYLVSFINGCSYFLQDQSAWTIANIANDCLECFNIIKVQGVLPALYKALDSSIPTVIQSVIFALNGCTQYDDPEVVNLIQLGLPKRLLNLMMQQNVNKNVFVDAAFTLSNCCYFSAKYSLDVLDLNSVQTIISILNNITANKDVDILVSTPLIRCLGFLSCSKEICELIFAHANFHRSIQAIFAVQEIYTVKQEIIWVLSNIAVSRSVIMNAHLLSIFDYLKSLLLKGNPSIILQILYFLTCLASENPYTILLMHHDTSFFPQILCLLKNEQSDVCQASKAFLQVAQFKLNMDI